MGLLTILVVGGAVILLALFVLGCSAIRVNRQDQRYRAFNEKEWSIEGLPWPAYWVRCFNAAGCVCIGCCCCGPACITSVLLAVIDKMLVQPALKQSIELMAQAEQAGTISAILCSAQARQDMVDRVNTYHDDIQASTTLTPFGKLLNYAGAYQCLQNHYGLLTLGMQEAVSRETIVEPVFIVSLPRTGTTILHRTMAQDRDRFRNFDMCDMMAPLPQPVPRWDTEGRTSLVNKGQSLLSSLEAIYPGWTTCMDTMHGFRLGDAEEDLGWYDTGLGHMYMDGLIKLASVHRAKPGGCAEIESKQVAQYRYAWLAMVMRIYQHVDKAEWERRKAQQQQQQQTSMSSPQLDREVGETTPLSPSSSNQQQYEGPCPTEHLPWLMKDPNHSAYLPELMHEFPSAKLIFAHRTPAEIIPSMAKLFVCFSSVEHIPGALGTAAREWGHEANLRVQQYCDGMVEFTKRQPPNSPLAIQKIGTGSTSRQRMDLDFRRLVQDVPGTIGLIYLQFYPDFPGPSDEAKEAFAKHMEANRREKLGNQRRSLEDFYLTEDEVAYTEYNNLFLK